MEKHPLYNDTGLIENNKPHVLYALVDKRAELDGLRIEIKKQLKKLEFEVETLDNAIKIFDPELEITIKPKKPKKTGYDPINLKVCRKLILYILEARNKPIPRVELHETVANMMSLDLSDPTICRKLKSTNTKVLSLLCKSGLIEEEKFDNLQQSLFSIKKIYSLSV